MYFGLESVFYGLLASILKKGRVDMNATTKKITFSIFGIVLGIMCTLQVVMGANLTIQKSWNPDEVLTADDLNTNFTDTETAINTKQDRVTGTCTGSAITAINENGTVACGSNLASGIASAENNNIALTNTYSNILSITVSAPAAGYVHVVATGMIELLNKTNATSSDYASVYVGVTNEPNAAPTAGNLTRFYRSGLDGTGSYNVPYTAQSLFPVAAGDNTFYIVGVENGGSGSGTLFFNRLTVTFHGNSM
jgi:hypothetical protein